jgi:hypothetical protein
MADGEEEDVEETWLFTATGNSCALCTSLDGQTFPYEPARPHDSCDCDITPTSAGGGEKECGNNEWRITNVEADHPGGDTLLFEVTIEIDCWDGQSWEATITVDFTDIYQGYIDRGEEFLDDMNELIFDEVADEAEGVMATVCRPCTDEPNV